jgi:hypothetical protein
MKKIQCESCQKIWYVNDADLNSQNLCPCCGVVIREKTEFTNYDSLDKAIFGAISLQGKGILQNPEKLAAFMRDIAPDLRKEIRVFSNNVKADYTDHLAIVFEQETETAKAAMDKLRIQFIEIDGLSAESADMLYDGLYGAFLYTKGIGTTNLVNVTIENVPSKIKLHSNKKSDACGNEPTESIQNGQRVNFGKYEWLVLDVLEDRALLLSEKIIKLSSYHDGDLNNVTWETCDLRKWLNMDFLNTFSPDELMQIRSVKNWNKRNPWYNTEGGNRTNDSIFLLSIEEVIQYFGDSGLLYHQPKDQNMLTDKYDIARKANYENQGENVFSSWWLRSPGSDVRRMAVVRSTGELNMFGIGLKPGRPEWPKLDAKNYFSTLSAILASEKLSYTRFGVRPALWINL